MSSSPAKSRRGRGAQVGFGRERGEPKHLAAARHSNDDELNACRREVEVSVASDEAPSSRRAACSVDRKERMHAVVVDEVQPGVVKTTPTSASPTNKLRSRAVASVGWRRKNQRHTATPGSHAHGSPTSNVCPR